VLHHRRMLIFRPQSIFQNDRGHAYAVEPHRYVVPFVRREASVTAAGTNDYRRAGGFVGGRLIKLDARNVFGRVALRARRARRPERNRRRLTGSLSRRLIRVLSERGREFADRKQEQSKNCHHEFHHLASLLKLEYFDRKPQRKLSSLHKRRTSLRVQKFVNP